MWEHTGGISSLCSDRWEFRDGFPEVTSEQGEGGRVGGWDGCPQHVHRPGGEREHGAKRTVSDSLWLELSVWRREWVELRLEEWAGATSYQDVQTLFWKQSGATFKQGNDAVFAMHKNPWLEQGGWVGREQDWKWGHQHTGYTATCSSVTNKRGSSGGGRERMDLRDVRGRVHKIWWLSVYEGLCVSPYLSFLYSPNLNQGEKKRAKPSCCHKHLIGSGQMLISGPAGTRSHVGGEQPGGSTVGLPRRLW